MVITGDEIHRVSKTLEQSEPILTENSVFEWEYLERIKSIQIIIERAPHSSAEKECWYSSATDVIKSALATSYFPIEANQAADTK